MADTALIVTIISIAAWALGSLIALLIFYFVIRQAIFHGLRAHTRWIDEGKD